ncbi:MAG: aminoacyl-tRNA hydrolase [Anaerolineales bacterium]|nr:aminoacyl-tRNA hydrolase [Anaerolineales bacterium]
MRYLIVGLGNPGKEYEGTRHNIGFQVVDALAAAYGLKFDQKKSNAKYADGLIAERRVMLAKPQTYMNASGGSVQGLMNFFQIPIEQLLVVADHLDIPLGTLRLRPKGGAGGQNGLKDIMRALGTQDFAQMRLGIGRPPAKMEPAAYVLRRFDTEEQPIAQEVIDRALKAIEAWLQEGVEIAMNRYNGTAEEVATRFAKSQTQPKPDEQ